jgi:nitroreductase
MPNLFPGADELLTTTRAVRRRLDLTRPVAYELVLECLAIAQQAPSAGNREGVHWVVITDEHVRSALAELYRRGIEDAYGGSPPHDDEGVSELARRYGAGNEAGYARMVHSIRHLYDRFHEVPVIVVPCIATLPSDTAPRGADVARTWGSVVQGTWSFMLAARARGLGTCYTTGLLRYERESAEILGIPYDEFMQTAHIPLAYTLGTDFNPGPRRSLDAAVHRDRW